MQITTPASMIRDVTITCIWSCCFGFRTSSISKWKSLHGSLALGRTCNRLSILNVTIKWNILTLSPLKITPAPYLNIRVYTVLRPSYFIICVVTAEYFRNSTASPFRRLFSDIIILRIKWSVILFASRHSSAPVQSPPQHGDTTISWLHDHAKTLLGFNSYVK